LPENEEEPVNAAACEVGQLALRLGEGYFAHSATMVVMKDLRSDELIRHPLESMLQVSIPAKALVPRKDHTAAQYDVLRYLNAARTSPSVVDELPRVWLVGSLLAVGDALKKHQYFDHAPILEFIYHLRNGIAHGNQFHFDQRGRARLKRYPAHNRAGQVKSPKQTEFEITEALQGKTILFDFMWPGDVLDLLASAGGHLMRL
jgi:hypothetical protein